MCIMKNMPGVRYRNLCRHDCYVFMVFAGDMIIGVYRRCIVCRLIKLTITKEQVEGSSCMGVGEMANK